MLQFAKRRAAMLVRLYDLARAGVEDYPSLKTAIDQHRQRRASGHEAMRRARSFDGAAPDRREEPTGEELVDQLSERVGVVVLQSETDGHGDHLDIGVATENLLSALVFLRSRLPEGRLYVGAREIDPRKARSARKALRAERVRFVAQSNRGTSLVVNVEPYNQVGPSQWTSQNSRNRILRGLFGDVLDHPGRTSAREILEGQVLEHVAAEKPVDVVYTWVNHADPHWQKLFAEFAPPDRSKTDSARASDSTALSRFHSNDELRYSLRSVDQNLPWVNRIFVFTNCAPPEWFDPNQDRLVWVRHEDVIPDRYLPTFNSHVIESFLHRIPGLSEDFLYQNDDVFIGCPLPKEFFFRPNGFSHSFLESYGMVSGPLTPGDPDYRNASRNSARLVREALGFVPTRLHRHTTFALKRSILDEIEARFPEEFAAMRQNRFRDMSDFNLTSFLYHHYAIGTGRAVERSVRAVFAKNSDIRWRALLRQTKHRSVEIFCINEGGDGVPSPAWHREVRALMERRFPQAAAWELPSELPDT